MNDFPRAWCALVLAATTGIAGAGSDPGVLLDATFNGEPLDQQIGTGGAELGQPVSIFPGLSAIVRAAPLPTPSLEFSHASSGTARHARFEFLGSEEVTHGDLDIRVRIEAAQFDGFDVDVREQGTSAQSFLSLTFTGFGDIASSDENGSLGVIGSYSVGVVHQLTLLFHLDDGTYDIDLDGVSLVSGRAHGVTARGIGSVLLGTGTLTAPGSLFYVGRLRVTRGDGVFHDGFD